MSELVETLVKDKKAVKPSSAICFLMHSHLENANTDYYSFINENYYFNLPHKLISRNIKYYFVYPDFDSPTTKFKKRLAELSQLKEGWDDEHASSILPEVIRNIESALSKNEKSDLWGNWIAYPDANGTITLMNKNGKASISIGAKEYSFYGEDGEQKRSGSRIPFETNSFLNDLRSLS